MNGACSIVVRGVVQGVGFRPFVYRLAIAKQLAGWVLNGEKGVEILVEGPQLKIDEFIRELRANAPAAAAIAEIEVTSASPRGEVGFRICESKRRERPTVRVSPDLPVCEDCLRELFDSSNPRCGYPYINCTNCGPRYTVIDALPYDRVNTTMRSWEMDAYCRNEYEDPVNRRFHAQPVACPACGPQYFLRKNGETIRGGDAVSRAAQLLREGKIVAIKGLGGYHLACDAQNAETVSALRERKYRKERPFALMIRDLEAARGLVELDVKSEQLLTSIAHPILLARAHIELPEVAPDNSDLGIMLPYTPLHHLLFAAGAPAVLVMTSANRSSEPIAYEDNDALQSLAGIADAFLIGERPIARRVDDSIVRVGVKGPTVLRRARGYAPGVVTTLPMEQPILALGADLKNSITLVVNGQAFVSQHIGDLDHYGTFCAFEQTVGDLLAMYEVRPEEVLLAHDAHPQYRSTAFAMKSPAVRKLAIQHHRAHVASVLAERGEWDRRVAGVSFDGTGYGDDGAIWGGEIFIGSLREGFARKAHLRPAGLVGGDAAAQFPVQAAAGFLAQMEEVPELCAPPFNFPPRYKAARELIEKRVRSFTTTSIGRLFDTVAALLGFTREITFEGQAAMWLEQLARGGAGREYKFPFADSELDFRPLLHAVIDDRLRGVPSADIARAVHEGIASGLSHALEEICASESIENVVLSGGVFQNQMLVHDLYPLLRAQRLQVWTNHAVPPNDGGISLGQAALMVFSEAAEVEQSGSFVHDG